MIEKLSDYIVKCDVLGSQAQGTHCRDNNNCMSGCVALDEHATNGKKRTKGKNDSL